MRDLPLPFADHTSSSDIPKFSDITAIVDRLVAQKAQGIAQEFSWKILGGQLASLFRIKVNPKVPSLQSRNIAYDGLDSAGCEINPRLMNADTAHAPLIAAVLNYEYFVDTTDSRFDELDGSERGYETLKIVYTPGDGTISLQSKIISAFDSYDIFVSEVEKVELAGLEAKLNDWWKNATNLDGDTRKIAYVSGGSFGHWSI